MADFGTTNDAGTIMDEVIIKMKDIMDMEENLGDLKTDFTRLEVFLCHIEKQFQDQQRALPEPVENCLERMNTALEEAIDLIDRAIPRPRCLGCCSLRNPKLSTQIRDWKPRFDRFFQDLERGFSIPADAQQIVSSAAPRAVVLRQPVPESGIVGLAIQSNQMKLQTWLGEARPQARIISVYGTGGVGKTLLLKLVYNHYKEVSGPFDVIIWLTVSKEYQIEKLQASIAETLNLKLEGLSDNDLRKLKLSDSLGNKKFLMILDDMWCPIDLINEIGVKFGDHNCSKVLISSRSRKVIRFMGGSEDYTLKIQPLSLEEGWELFTRNAFANLVVPTEDIEATAREIASQCQGLPLALNVVGATMGRINTAVEWRRAFSLMTSADPSFLVRYSTIDKELYEKLKWSYDYLRTELKICFLYCAVFPENAEIPVETLVEMWSAEKLVTRMDVGHMYIDVLVDGGLFEYVAAGYETIKTLHGQVRRYVEKRVRVHNVLRHLAIYIGQSEEKWFFATGQQRQNFPSEDEIRDCKRISVGHDIQDLPTDLVCSELVSLVLANNEKIREVPERFLSTAVSLKILDLSGTLITSLPTSLGQLGQLEFLKLTGCYLLENLPESIGNLSHLRFLNLEYCQSLNSLPDSIGELRNLEHLSLESCEILMVNPHAISRLTSLNKLFLPLRGGRKSWATSVKHFANLSCLMELAAKNVEDFANLSNLMELAATTSVEAFANPSNLMELAAISVEDFANLSNLMELTAVVKEEIKGSTMTTWTNLRRLEVWFYYNADRDDVVEDIFPFNMETLTKLEHFELHFCERVSLPNCISQFENLTTLYLSCCPHLRELTACQIGSFPRLKRLELENLNRLESMVGSSVVSSEEIMPGLEEIRITDCRSLKRLGTKKFLRLKRLSISGCEEFEALEIESAGLPMLEDLQLFFLEKCEIIVGPSGVINDEVMPKLKVLKVHYCGLLKLGLEKLPDLRSISIIGCEKLRELPLEIGSGGFPVLESLSVWDCANLENIVGSLDVWNDETMPALKLLDIRRCSLLRRLPTGIENLSNLHQIIGGVVWWQNLIWKDERVKNKIFRLFTYYRKLTL